MSSNNMKHVWLEKGCVGFRVDAVSHLFENKDVRDEPFCVRTNGTHSPDYKLHHYTYDLPAMSVRAYEIVRHLR